MTFNYRGILKLVVAILSVFLFFGGPDYYSPLSFQAVWNLGHLFYFALLVLWVYPYVRKYFEAFRFQCLVLMVLTLVLGIGIELVQYRFQRTPDIGDVARNMIGCLIGILFLIPGRKTLQKAYLRFFQAVTLFLVALQIYPAVAALTDEHLARQQFPILSDFESRHQIDRWKGKDIGLDSKVFLTGSCSMRAQLNTDLYSGISLNYFPNNWECYNKFQFSIYNPSDDTIDITCRVHDRKHTLSVQRYDDRFNRSYTLHQGWNTIGIDMEDIRSAPISGNSGDGDEIMRF